MEIEQYLEEIFKRNTSSQKISLTPKKYYNLAQECGFQEGPACIKEVVEGLFLKALHTGNINSCIQILKRSAKVRGDGDGIKSNNKLGGYDKGSLLLRKIALALKNEAIMSFCQKFSIHIEVISRVGGDEFDFVLFCDREMDEITSYEVSPEMVMEDTILNLFVTLINFEVANTPFPELNFHSEYTQKQLGEYGRELLRKAEESGEKFYFTPSISVASCTLMEGFLSYMNNDGDFSLSIEELVKKLMGEVEDICHARVDIVKKFRKKTLWMSEDPREKMQAFVTIRGDEDREFAMFKDESRRLTAIFENIQKELTGILKSFTSQGDLNKLMKDLHAVNLALEENLKKRQSLEDVEKEFLVTGDD